MAKATATTGKAGTKPATSTKPTTGKEKEKAVEKTTEKKVVASVFVPTVFTKKEIASRVVSELKCTHQTAEDFTNAVLNGIYEIASSLETGKDGEGKFKSDILQLTGLMSFQLTEHQARLGYNNQKGHYIMIPEKVMAKVSVGKAIQSHIDETFNKGKVSTPCDKEGNPVTVKAKDRPTAGKDKASDKQKEKPATGKDKEKPASGKPATGKTEKPATGKGKK